MDTIKAGFSLVLAVCVAGLKACCIYWGLYPISLKTVVRNSSS